jgi:hypothetical protein
MALGVPVLSAENFSCTVAVHGLFLRCTTCSEPPEKIMRATTYNVQTVKCSAYALRLSLMASPHGSHVPASCLVKLMAVGLFPHCVVAFK